MDYRRKTSRSDEPSSDFPMYSRLFIVCDKKTEEDEIRDAFLSFGTIEDIRIPRDHHTGQTKGVIFIKFSKTSEAAFALEKMHMKTLPSSSRPIKVMVATNRSEIQSDDDHEKHKRVFITVPRDSNEEVIKEYFSTYGSIESIHMLKDRNTGENKGFAYVKFRKFSQAALAVEESDPSYRAIFAFPKGHNRRQETSFETSINSLASASAANIRNPLFSAMNVHPEGYKRVNFLCCPYLIQRDVEKLFDIVPGMVDCQFVVDLMYNTGKGTVTYSNPVSAAYAVEKLNKFEYPPGAKIFVKPDNVSFDPQERNFSNVSQAMSNLKNAIAVTTNSSSPDLAQLAEAIAEASKLIKVATSGINDDIIPDSNDLNYCSVELPKQQPLADIDSPAVKRCFLVCKPQPPPLTVLRDVFCRFGDLINVYTLPGKTVGYARYATTKAADEAIRVLHGAEICGVRIKVLEADDEAPPKRAKHY